MYKKCDEILKQLEQEGKIKRLDFHFPEKQPLKLRLKDLLEDEVDEKYYLSDKQLNYILDMKDVALKSGRDINDRIVNPQIAKTISCRGAVDQRADVTNFTIDNCNEELKVKDVKQFISNKYKNFIEENGYIPDMFNPYNNAEIKDIAPTQTTQCGSTTSSATILIRNKSLRETLEQNNIEKDISFIDGYNRNIRKDDLSGTITTRVNDSNNTFIAIKNATKQGYLEAHDGDGCYISNIDKKRGTVQKEMIPTLKTSPDIGCVTTDLRIRKLTEKECLKLMGFDDEDYEKIKSIGISRSQIYKQAGNSIVVNVLEAIFKELFSEYIPNLDKWSDLD